MFLYAVQGVNLKRKKFGRPKGIFIKLKKYESRKYELYSGPVITVNEEEFKEAYLAREAGKEKKEKLQEPAAELFDFGSCDENVFFSNSAYWDNLMKSFTRHK